MIRGSVPPTPAWAQLAQNYLQVFELEWDDLERRMPDLFLAGYDAVWLPPPSKASFTSVGYDPFDRFDLGQPPLATIAPDRARTTYGTEETFRAMVQEFHRAGFEVYPDGVFNHNGGRNGSVGFQEAGGYPGFWLNPDEPPTPKGPGDDWGDFHDGSANDIVEGDLVGLIDIAQESNNQFIRHPVTLGDPDNIPAGTIFNKPDAGNARFYPDQGLAAQTVVNPGTSRHPGTMTFTRFPFNTASPLDGDPILDNATGLLMRWAQWMHQEHDIDGFRLDALKHAPTFFWDIFFDASIHKARSRPDGVLVNPLTFGESVSGNFTIINDFIRKDSFANRDALDLQGAARLRDLLNAAGLGSWSDITSDTNGAPLDVADDGIVNGSLGMNHVFSHDNGTVGDGGSLPPLPTARQQGFAMHAYMLMRPGRAIVYHNARGVPIRSGGFYPREGASVALGWDPAAQAPDDTITTLVNLRRQVGTGFYFQLNANVNDVLVFERAFNGQANCLVGLNDRWDAGTQSVTVDTAYDQGTRLHEMTGNASDPQVDPNDDIPETIVVGANGQVTLTIPNNVSSAGEHAKGYVVYAQALPEATLEIVGQSGTIAPDDAALPDWFQRLSEICIVEGDSFDIRVETTQADPLDPDTDDNAIFTFDTRTRDWNGNAAPDTPFSSLSFGGFEDFLDTNEPLFGSGNATGLYEQGIDATDLDEGMHYLTVIVFRHRDAGASPIYRELRKVIYVDREPPQVSLDQAGMVLEDNSPEFIVRAHDRTVEELHLLRDVPDGVDPLTLINITTQVPPYDRFEYRRSLGTFADGDHEITIVAIEPSGRSLVQTETVTFGDPCPADFNGDGAASFPDVGLFLSAFASGDPAADFNGDGATSFPDVGLFLSAFSAGCP